VTRRAAGLLLVLLLGLADPGRAGEVRDMAGRTVRVPDRPARVVSLAPSLTEIVFALEAADRLVGVTQHCDYPPAAAEKPRVGGIYTPNFEVILSLRPDLVMATTEANRDDHVRALDDLGLPVYVVRGESFAAVLASIDRVGALLGREETARRLADGMRRRADAITRAVSGARPPRVLYVIWGNPLIVPGRGAMITDLIRRAGGASVSADEPLEFPRFAVEEAVARRPERVVIARHGRESLEGRLREWPHLALLPAVREGRVHAIDGDLMVRAGPRIVDGLEALARLLHPQVIR
jgi:iron complex transport system substrate-binding protein